MTEEFPGESSINRKIRLLEEEMARQGDGWRTIAIRKLYQVEGEVGGPIIPGEFESVRIYVCALLDFLHKTTDKEADDDEIKGPQRVFSAAEDRNLSGFNGELAMVLAQRDKLEKAEHLLAADSPISPLDQVSVMFAIAEGYMRRNDRVTANKYLNQICSITGMNPYIQERISQVLDTLPDTQ
ncbi:MAG TPA: hypothetical protein VMR51_01820 [Patescibacteria group bacterium]|jgi:hypothetical protein|nr:hypothetical protein [Patescibacteria group bacterium]